MAFTLAVSYIPNIIRGEWFRALIGLGLISIIYLAYSLIKKGYVEPVLHSLMIIFNLVILIYAGLHGREAGTHLHFITSTLAAAFLFNYGKKSFLYLYVIIPLLLWLFLEFIGFQLFDISFLSDGEVVLNSYLNQITFAIMLVFFAFATIRQQSNFEEKVKNFQDQITSQNEFLSNTVEKLQQNNRDLDTLLNTVSHDVRSPIASAQGIVTILKSVHTESERDELLNYLSKSLNQVLESTSDILTLAKSKTNKLKLKPIYLKPLVQSIFDLNKNNTESPNLVLELNFNSSFRLMSDAVLLKSILQNLISNAVKFLDENKSTNMVRISAEEHENFFEISVWDNGKGISKKNEKAVFDMFKKANDYSEGFGLGLYLVKEFSNQLQAKIEINTIFGEFTCFTIQHPKFKLEDFSA